MGQLLGALYPRPQRAGEFRSGPAVYINVENLDQALVLADALEEHGLTALAKELASFARGVERELRREYVPGEAYRPTTRKKGVTSPRWEKWADLRRRIDHAITDIAEGVDFHREAQAPYVRLQAERVRLDQGGYDRGGRYWGRGLPLYRVTADLPADITRYVLDHPSTYLGHRSGIHLQIVTNTGEAWIDHHVRADDAKDAREQVARKLGLRTRRRV